MSNIQLFEQAFAVDFPVEVAEMVLDRISGLYGTEFSKKYSGDSDAELIQRACTVLNGLTPADITRGIMRMNSEEFCPTLPRFRNWCEQGGDWWTADMAWAKAMQFEADPQTKITKLTKCALDEVRYQQEMWIKPQAKKQLSENSNNRKGVPCPPELAAKIGNMFKRIGGEV